jgi:hypothetical protein
MLTRGTSGVLLCAKLSKDRVYQNRGICGQQGPVRTFRLNGGDSELTNDD